MSLQGSVLQRAIGKQHWQEKEEVEKSVVLLFVKPVPVVSLKLYISYNTYLEKNLHKCKGTYGLSSIYLGHCMCQDTIRKYPIISLRGRVFVSPCWDTGWERSLSSLVWGEFGKEQSMEICSVSQTSSCSGHLRLFTRHRGPSL